MCGISGVFWHNAPPEHRRHSISTMNAALAHRGPDDAGLWQGARVDLAHRRLSVIDTSRASHQPMCSADGNFVLVFNGEIYNYRELRTELQALGRSFRTEGDTEVLLEGFTAWGCDIFRRCNGMFAAAIYDQALETLVLARDRLGIKPLFYAPAENHLAFASELAPLVQSGLADTTVNPRALDAYFQFLYTPGPDTFYQGISKLEPGTMLTVRRGEVHHETYWRLEYAIDPAWTLDSAAEQLDTLLADAVRLRERSDVPLGAFLSGGLDSSSVVAMASRNRTQPLKTFSIGFDDTEADELAYARAVANHYQTDHREALLRPDLASLLPGLAGHFGEPFADSSILPMWLVSQLARKDVTVALSGDGGDELFAGYTWTHMNTRVARYRAVPAFLRHGVGAVLAGLPQGPRINRYRRFHQDSFLDPMASFERRLSCFDATTRSKLLRPEVLDQRDDQENPYYDQVCREAASFAPDDQMLYLDSRMYLPDDILTKVDRMSMAHGLEARVPLLDHRIVEFAATVPFPLKYQRGQSKRVLKHLMRNKLPPETLRQRKRGFSLPLHRWMREDLVPLVSDTVLSPRALLGEYLDTTFVHGLWQDHQRRQENYGHHLWAILMFELWLQWRNEH